VKKNTLRRAASVTGPSAALLAAALRAQSEGVFIGRRAANRSGYVMVFANEQFCAMTGYSRGELAGQSQIVLHMERTDRERLTRWLKKSQPGSLTGEGYVLRKDGTMIYTAWSFSHVIAARGQNAHFVATYRDMTVKRSLQEALVHAQRLDALGRLAGGVAHDFNNLISVINGYCELLATQVADRSEALHAVGEIHRAGRKAAKLTRQLLAFGRRQPMDARVINLNQIVRDNAEILERLLGSNRHLVLELAGDLGNVRTDPAQFQQVLLNLTINARDALRDQGRMIIRTANREIMPEMHRRLTDIPPGRYVTLTVSDNGSGMDVETQKHLFEPFFTTKPEGQGTGLGLALVYGVVQQSGGHITVSSKPENGSTFEIMLPEARAPLPARAAAKGATRVPRTRGHETVLLVEEDEVLRDMVAGVLTSDGYRVIDAALPREARDKARAADKPVQILIANLAGEGENLARALHAARPGLRVLNICNHNAEQTLVWLPPEHQFSLPKPFALSELVRVCRRLLDA
jgi:PAS domain S-box-containing protein